MSQITYLEGDATDPKIEGLKVIAHISNNKNAWGRGFVVAISKKWKNPEAIYRATKSLRLGEVQFVPVEMDIHVCNMIAQDGFPSMARPVAVDYKALSTCLKQVYEFCKENNATLHMPRIGCGIGGSTWDMIEPIINKAVPDIEVYVYDLPQ